MILRMYSVYFRGEGGGMSDIHALNAYTKREAEQIEEEVQKNKEKGRGPRKTRKKTAWSK